jgi:hypothetical protein
MRRAVRGLVIALAVAGMGCGARKDLGPMLGGRRSKEPVLLTVQNNRFEDAAIYALWRGAKKERIGLAIGTTSTTFEFPWVADVVELQVDFIAADGYTVDPIEVSPGDHLDLVILGVK